MGTQIKYKSPYENETEVERLKAELRAVTANNDTQWHQAMALRVNVIEARSDAKKARKILDQLQQRKVSEATALRELSVLFGVTK